MLTASQRRRTQNRNSQRIYRQRRMEERQRFEERAIAAEEAAKELRQHLTELQSVIACLRYQVQQLEAEKAMLQGTCGGTSARHHKDAIEYIDRLAL